MSRDLTKQKGYDILYLKKNDYGEKMRKILALFISVVAILSVSANVEFKQPYNVYKDISYGKSEQNNMDIYIPTSASRAKYNGCIIYIHGGSWYSGKKESMEKDCIFSAQNGYVCATMNYTLMDAEDYSIYKVLDDVTAAAKKLKSFCKSKEISLSKMALAGHSAGGHISMLYAYSRAKEAPMKIAFTVSRAGPVEFHDKNWRDGVSFMALILNGGVTDYENNEMTDEEAEAEIEKAIKKVSPYYHINSSSVPTIMAYGKKDTTVSYNQATMLDKRLTKYGVKHDFIIYPNSGHKLNKDDASQKQYEKKLLEYCKAYF